CVAERGARGIAQPPGEQVQRAFGGGGGARYQEAQVRLRLGGGEGGREGRVGWGGAVCVDGAFSCAFLVYIMFTLIVMSPSWVFCCVFFIITLGFLRALYISCRVSILSGWNSSGIKTFDKSRRYHQVSSSVLRISLFIRDTCLALYT